MLEQQLNLTYNTTNSMQATAYAIDNASVIADQVSATKSAMVTLRKQHADISLDELEDMQDDMADLLADADALIIRPPEAAAVAENEPVPVLDLDGLL